MITGVRLRNWKSHLDSDLSFSKGVNGIIGIMGSGKSSIMQAISFALFGTFSGLSSRRLAINDLIMRKPHSKEASSVEIGFEIGGKKYTVSREIRLDKGTVNAEIREGGKLLEVSPRGVTGQVERILQTDHDLFSRAVYSEQNGLDYFLNIPKGKRMAQIDDMLKLDRYEKAREAGVSVRNRMGTMREERMKTIREMEERNVEERIRATGRELEKKREEMEEAGRSLGAVRKEREELEKILERADEELKERRERVSELNGKIMFISSRVKELDEKKERMEKIRKELGKLKKSLGDDPLGEYEKRKKSLEDSMKELHRKEALLDETRKGLDDLMESGDRCPVCESPLPSGKKEDLRKHKESHIRKLEQEIRELGESAGKEESGLSEMKDMMDEMKGKEREMEDLGDLEQNIKAGEKESEELRRMVSELVSRIREAEERESERRGKLRDAHGRERELAVKLEDTEEMIREKESVLEELEKDRDTLERHRKDVERFGGISESMGRFTNVLSKTQDQLRDEFLKTVNFIMNSVWTELYPYGDFGDIRLAIENDYVLQLKGTRGWTSVDMVSGGERTLASLSLRIAFSLAFTPNLKWLILDEPTHNLDQNAIQHFGNVLKDRLGNFIDQVFLITHEESLSDYITGNLYRMERDKETDGVTRVVAV